MEGNIRIRLFSQSTVAIIQMFPLPCSVITQDIRIVVDALIHMQR